MKGDERPQPSWRGAALCAVAAAALLTGRARAQARAVDPTLPHQRVVGTPAGPAPLERLDPARTGRSSVPLPVKPRVLWRTRAPGGIEYPVAVARDGSIVLSGSVPLLSEVTASGRLRWSVRTGQATPVTAPIITSNDTRVVVTSVPSVIGVSPSGHVRFRRALPASSVSHFAPPLGLDEGDFVLGLGAQVLRLAPNGEIQARAGLPEEVESILSVGRRLLLIGRSGAVFVWRPPAAPTRLATFGAKPEGGVAACGPRALCAVIDEHHLVKLDLVNGSRRTKIDGSAVLQGPPAVLPSGALRVVTADGLLLGQGAHGQTLQIALEPPSLAPGGGPPPPSAGPPVIVDASGALAFVRPGLPAGVVDRRGIIRRASGAACSDPVDVAPEAPHRMVVACRSGLLWLVGD